MDVCMDCMGAVWVLYGCSGCSGCSGCGKVSSLLDLGLDGKWEGRREDGWRVGTTGAAWVSWVSWDWELELEKKTGDISGGLKK